MSIVSKPKQREPFFKKMQWRLEVTFSMMSWFFSGLPAEIRLPGRSDVVGYQIAEVKYYVVTDRHYLTAEQIATVYKLRWTIESFFKWWKKHLKIYHLIARSKYGLLFQMLDGLITYLLMAIYCREQFNGQDEIDKIENQLFKEQYKLSLAKS